MTLTEPTTLAEAQAFVGQDIKKYFEPNAEAGFEGGWFHGKVTKVDENIPDSQGNTYAFLYRIKYEDGDKEHMTFPMLVDVLLNPTTPAVKKGGCASENKGHTGRTTGTSRRGAPSFADITNWGNAGQLTMTGAERRSRRPQKRKTDADFEYEEDTRTAKKAAAAAGSASASRFGIRPVGAPGAIARGALGGAIHSSESTEDVVMREGVRAVGLPGHLVKIELVNFMCHSHFTMDFGMHVTFVSGTNGSGKSAVLQALQCCLGVKASQTGRAPNFKSFIRTGCDEAIIRVTLYNKPYKDHDAFQHDVYGDTITVERRIAKVGTASTYLLKDHTGRIQGRRREDLDALLATLSINAANPVTVMTQDTARSFLAGSSTSADKEKWALYMDATQLSLIRYNLEVSQQQIRLMDESVAKIRGEYEVMQQEHGQLSAAIEALRGLEVWRQEIGRYEQVLAWCCVEEHERAIAQIEHQLGTLLPPQLALLEARVGELEAGLAALKQSAGEKEQFLLTFNQRAQELSRESEELKAARMEAHKALVAARRKLQSLQRRLQEECGRKETLLSAVQEASTQMAAASQAVTIEYTRDLEEADRNHRRVGEQVKAAVAAKERAKAEVQAAQDAEGRVKQDMRTNETQLKRLEDSVRQLQAARANKLARFGGSQMVELVKAISRQRGQFHQPPIGPLGAHLTLADDKWAVAVECVLGLSLTSFLVSDLHDCRLLQQLVRQSGLTGWRKPSVTVVNFGIPAYNIPASHQPPPHVTTVLRVLGCNHSSQAHTIINHLVDVCWIERTALGESERECSKLGFRTSQVRACFGTNGAKWYTKGRGQTSLAPPHWLKFQAPRLGGDVAQQGQGLREEIQGLAAERGQLEQDLAVAQQRVTASWNAVRDARKAAAALQARAFQTKMRLDNLLSQPPPEVAATQAGGGDTGEDEVQRDIMEATQAVVDLEQQQSEKEEEVAAAERAQQQAHDAWQAKKQEMDRLQDENAQFVTAYQAEVEQQAGVEAALQGAAEQRDEMLRKKAWLEAVLAQQQAALEANQAVAPMVCSREEAQAARAELEAAMRQKDAAWDEARLAEWFSTKIIKKKIERLHNKIREHEKQAGGKLEDLEIRMEAVQVKMDGEGRRFQSAIAAYDMLNAALGRRFKKLAKLFTQVHDEVNRRFNHYMSRKGHLGSIKLDKENQTLQLKVAIGGKSGCADGGKVKDLKQLSGGERSFTTVAFTLALGAQTDMPFRCSDEFDVFMDAVNRRVAMESLFNFAHEHDALQFVFLTPQDIAAVEDARQGCARMGLRLPADFVKVVQMRPARENATHA